MQLSCQYCSDNRLFYCPFWEKYTTSISRLVIWGSLLFILLAITATTSFLSIWSGHVNQQIDMGRHLRYNGYNPHMATDSYIVALQSRFWKRKTHQKVETSTKSEKNKNQKVLIVGSFEGDDEKALYASFQHIFIQWLPSFNIDVLFKFKLIVFIFST